MPLVIQVIESCIEKKTLCSSIISAKPELEVAIILYILKFFSESSKVVFFESKLKTALLLNFIFRLLH